MNDYYVGELGKINKERYIDTSVVMKPNRLKKFILKAKETLLSNNIKIIVTNSVMNELNKHIKFNDKDKKELAKEGLDILNNNRDIFVFEDELNGDYSKAFADKELLATIMNNRSSKSQMLITNDRNLAQDATKINDMKSVNGGYIYVCYLDRDGELQKSENETTNINISSDNVDGSIYLGDYNTTSRIITHVVVGLLSYIIGRNHKQIKDFIINLNRNALNII